MEELEEEKEGEVSEKEEGEKRREGWFEVEEKEEEKERDGKT
ncbi:MAG: hypothetical protein ACTSYA_00050 [Candidatus Kariarchaeaceae archaeon]